MTHFIIEKKMAGKKSWIKIGETDSKHTTFATDKVEEGKAYQFRIIAVNAEGLSDPLETEEIFAGEPIGKHLSIPELPFLMWLYFCSFPPPLPHPQEDIVSSLTFCTSELKASRRAGPL